MLLPAPICSIVAVLMLFDFASFASATPISCPDAPAQYARDWSVNTQGAIGALGRLKAGELANQTQVITKPLFDNVPNSDRFLVAQSLISMFCKMIAASSLPDQEKLDRMREFTGQMMAPWVGAPSGTAVSPVLPGKSKIIASDSPMKGGQHASDLEKYIDPTAHRSPDKKNVALKVLNYDGADVESLEGAARRALTERGYNVLPLFRPAFAKDEVGQTLFAGNAAVAARLQLRKHCDSVLLARLRLIGPVSNINGLFISEWALDIRALSPETGSVTDERRVSEKGGGVTPDASKADAVRKLEESVEFLLTEWSWT